MNKKQIIERVRDILEELRKGSELYIKKIDFNKLAWIGQSKKHNVFIFMTLGVFLIGGVFGSILKGYLDNEEPVSEILSLDAIYVVYLGAFETYEEVLAIEGKVKELGYGIDINLDEGEYVVFSHIAGMISDLEEVEQKYNEYQVDYKIERIENTEANLGWDYFFKAVHQIPYEMDANFIEEFAQDALFIWGYYVALAGDSLENLSLERQQMLREIYHWLNI